MDAVGLVESRLLGHAVEEEGIERHAVLVGEPLVEPIELGGVLGPEIARRQHAGQPHRDAGSLQAGDDGVEVALGGDRVGGAQCVVAAQFHQHDVGLVGQHPVQALDATRGRIAGHTMIDDGDVAAGRRQGGFEAGRERLVGLHAVAGGQAVAQHGKLDRRGLCVQAGSRQQVQEQSQECRDP